MDLTINLPTIVTLVLSAIGLVSWFIRLEGRVTSTGKSSDDMKMVLSAQEALIQLHKQQFHEYQLQAAKEFMTQAAFGEIKRELISEIGRMETRLEAQIERIGTRPPARRTTGQS